MTHGRSQRRGFSLVEVMVVTAILAVITTTATVALGKMFAVSAKTRDAARSTETARSALFGLSAELRSSETVQCEPGEIEVGEVKLRADTLVYTHNGQPGDPHKPAGQCTIRLAAPGADLGPGLIKEVRSELRGKGEPISTELILPDAVGFEIKCLTRTGWTSKPRGDVYAVSISARVVSADYPGSGDVYTTAVNVPRSLWQGGAPLPLEEVKNDV